MRNLKLAIIVFMFFAFSAFGNEVDLCLANSNTQSAMNSCEGVDFKKADAELNRVFKLIQLVYSDNTKFLIKLKNSQNLWIKLRDANLEMTFPLKDKRSQYGSAYPMCSLGINTRQTLQRIEYLKQWLKGIEEGDVCNGSVKRPNEIRDALKI